MTLKKQIPSSKAYEIINGNEGQKPYTPVPLKAANEGMVILKGSSAPLKTNRKPDPRLLQKRDELLAKEVIVISGERFVFQRDYLFKSPSGASCFLLGGSSNGRVDWKTEKGITLNDYQDRSIAQTEVTNNL